MKPRDVRSRKAQEVTVVRPILTTLALAGLSVILVGGSATPTNGSMGLALMYFVGAPLVAISLLALSIRTRTPTNAEIRRERAALLGSSVIAAALFFPGLAMNSTWLMLIAATVPVLGIVAYLTVLRLRAPAR